MTKSFTDFQRAAAMAVTPAAARENGSRPSEPAARDLSEVLGCIYDASLDPGLWPGTLREVADFVGGHGASLLSKDPAAPAASLQADDGAIARDRIEAYFGTYVRMDMHSLAHCVGEVGRAVVSSEITTPEDLASSRFHKEWVAPQGLVDFVNVPLERTGDSTTMFGVFRSELQGPADEAMLARTELLGPHLRRAVLVGRSLQEQRGRADDLAEALDGLSAGVFLLDDEGRLAHANASGQAMLRDRGPVDLRNRRLVPRREAEGHAFRDAAARAAQGDAALGSVERVLEDRDGEAYLAQVLPLAEGRRRLGRAGRGAAAAVFVRRAADPGPGALPALARRFDLTPSELRVLVALAEVGGVPDVAESLGVAVSTVKTHVHRLMAKTGAARQADLGKLLVGWSARLLR